jgi:hypothetical protein
MTAFNTGAVSFNLPTPTVATKPVTAYVGTSVVYSQQQPGLVFNRSNAGTAMTDTLQAPSVTTGDISAIFNGWNMVINNIDATAAITLTPNLPATINGTTSVVINAGQTVIVFTDGINYFAQVTTNITSILAPVTSVTGSPINLGTYASGSTILRSNATVAMADTLPNANTLPNGWHITVFNTDASATDTITPATSTINGGATLAITFGKSTTIYGNGVNYFATTPV